MKKLLLFLLGAFAIESVMACTNFIVTRGASTDGTVMVTYAADSHALYGALYKHTPLKKEAAMMDVTEWDTGKYLGQIPQAKTTYHTIGNMNEHSVIITETTWGGLSQLEDKTGGIDYGSLIYITLQRARTAREAIDIIVELANTHGYYSEGESFSIADQEEAWIMELIGKGTVLDENKVNTRKGIVWVARRIPDGYVSGHANFARISTFPKDDPKNCLYAPDVISFARENGLYSGSDDDFSFTKTYCPPDFGGLRGCEARVWSFFNRITSGMDKYLDYAMGYNPQNAMPLWVKPSHKISPKELFDCMRDHYEGTPMDMTQDIGAGGNGCPYRWRPMYFKYDGKEYLNERATATQQTGFWMCGQARRGKTGILWFGVDDAATSCLTPVYCNSTEVPYVLDENNGSMLKYSSTSMFWLFNRVTNFAYGHYNEIAPAIRKKADEWENACLKEVEDIDRMVDGMSKNKRQKTLTKYSLSKAYELFRTWKELDEYLLVKFIDGNIKQEDEKGFIDNGNKKDIPGKIVYGGYNDIWKKAVAESAGKTLEVKNF